MQEIEEAVTIVEESNLNGRIISNKDSFSGFIVSPPRRDRRRIYTRARLISAREGNKDRKSGMKPSETASRRGRTQWTPPA